MQVQPGWYPDPSGRPGWRWWDGAGWTGHAAPAAGSSAGPGGWAAGSHPGGPLTSLAWAAIGAWAAGVALPAVYVTVLAGTVHRQFAAWFQAAQFESTFGGPPPSLPGYVTALNVVYLLQAAALAGQIMLAVWQCRAASRARWAGFPARRTPRFGAWSWFIPVANLWIPYQALRDCLPPGHPDRHLSASAFLPWVLAAVVTAGAAAVAVAADTAAVSLIAVAAAAGMTAAAAAGMARYVAAVERTLQSVGA